MGEHDGRWSLKSLLMSPAVDIETSDLGNNLICRVTYVITWICNGERKEKGNNEMRERIKKMLKGETEIVAVSSQPSKTRAELFPVH